MLPTHSAWPVLRSIPARTIVPPFRNASCHIKVASGATLRGFTLIELIVTVAVLAILVAAAAPSFRNLMANNRVSGLTNELSAALNLARSEAIKRGVAVTICKSSNTSASLTTTAPGCDSATTTSWPDGWAIFLDPDRSQSRSGSGEDLIRVGQPATPNVIQTGSTFARAVTFFPNGSSSASGTAASDTLTLCVAPAQRQILISRTGQIQILKGSCT